MTHGKATDTPPEKPLDEKYLDRQIESVVTAYVGYVYGGPGSKEEDYVKHKEKVIRKILRKAAVKHD
jgi:hypothetical protein